MTEFTSATIRTTEPFTEAYRGPICISQHGSEAGPNPGSRGLGDLDKSLGSTLKLCFLLPPNTA
jgi:hypothetical protein